MMGTNLIRGSSARWALDNCPVARVESPEEGGKVGVCHTSPWQGTPLAGLRDAVTTFVPFKAQLVSQHPFKAF